MPLPNSLITKYAKPKTNIMECLDCGSYHEKGTICGKCYSKVKNETKDIFDEMNKDDKFKYKYPSKEIAFLYQGEEQAKEGLEKENKVVVQLSKKRPSWFSNSLFTKVSTK